MIDRRRRALLGGLAGLPLASLPGCAGEPTFTQAGFTVFGQVWTLRFADTPTEQVNAAVNAAQGIVEPLYRRLHPWRDSELTRLNRQLAEHGEAAASAEVRALIRAARPLFEASHGRFDPSIGGLIALWGFHRDAGDTPITPPAESVLDAWLADAPSLDDVRIDDERVITTNPRVQFDFNALAEGFAAEQVLDALKTAGITDCLLDSGGDLYTLGQAGRRDWQLGIRDPRGDPRGRETLGGVRVSGPHALCSSGSYERRLRYRGKRFGHIIDPLTARPTRHNSGTTVLGRDPVIADGAATALMLLSPAEAEQFARHLGLDGILLVTENGRPWRDAGMQSAMSTTPAGRAIDWHTP
ncbi:FAD:protein FMN transferase [Guyparkeria halophila]|uniref:FAD:protein FMN transferase n=1 Tax=Guyparkeria halophila TaxID=47960 RepID=A0ABZ0YZQ9_9GAMM|nr:FAD:protein FMN transferase [Guyparkeria halophila]WQH16640.1 FAD:protein FMN transferase [Guyparkeria halophila]